MAEYNCNAGDGPYPFGYDILEGYPKEAFGNNGLEVTVVYEGPYASRNDFLDVIFGRWRFNRLACCAQVMKYPKPFSNSGEFVEKPAVGDDGGVVIITGSPTVLWMNESKTLWPDTYSIENCGAEGHLLPALVGKKICPENPLETPLVIQAASDYLDTYPIRCKAQITINYREKSHARIPLENCPCVPSLIKQEVGAKSVSYIDPSLKYGYIPEGTFAEVEIEPRMEFLTVPNRNFTYRLDCGEDQAITGDFVNCDRSDANTLAQINELHVPEDVDAGVPFSTADIRIKWTNVPIVPRRTIQKLAGTINSSIFVGYPKGAVAFAQASERRRTTARGESVYDIEYLFVAKTARAGLLEEPSDIPSAINDCYPQICGVIGIWNRRYSQCAQVLGMNGTDYVHTHWVPIVTNDELPADADPPLEYEDFQQLFTIPIKRPLDDLEVCPDPPICNEMF